MHNQIARLRENLKDTNTRKMTIVFLCLSRLCFLLAFLSYTYFVPVILQVTFVLLNITAALFSTYCAFDRGKYLRADDLNSLSTNYLKYTTIYGDSVSFAIHEENKCLVIVEKPDGSIIMSNDTKGMPKFTKDFYGNICNINAKASENGHFDRHVLST